MARQTVCYSEDSYHSREEEAASLKRARTRVNWTPYQKKAYLKFIEKYSQQFASEQIRRNQRVYSKLSKFLKTKSSRYCRLYHNRMIAQYGSCAEIIRNEKQLDQEVTKVKAEFVETIPQPCPNQQDQLNNMGLAPAYYVDTFGFCYMVTYQQPSFH